MEKLQTISDAIRVHDEASLGLDDTTRIQLGVPWLDEATRGGVAIGSLVVVGARTGVGKSFMLLDILASTPHPALYVSCEEPLAEVGRRCSSLDDATARKIHFLKPYAPKLSTILKAARVAVEQHGVRVVAVDYLQRIRYDGPEACFSRANQIECILGDLKEFAAEHACTIIMAAQVKRPWRPDDWAKKPMMTELKDSADTENMAELCILLHENEHGLVEAWTAKIKNGKRSGRQLYSRDPETGWFLATTDEELYTENEEDE
jgi:replicative DNA helicase